MVPNLGGKLFTKSMCGSQVHHLQVVLNQHGYYCGEDETVWWQFGSDTYSSLLTFQVWQLPIVSLALFHMELLVPCI